MKDKNFQATEVLHQGDCVQLLNREDIFQVIGVDDKHKRCWVRRWPLLPKGSPVFEIPIKQVASPVRKDRFCSLGSS